LLHRTVALLGLREMSDLNLRHSEIGDTHLLVQVNGRSRAALGLGLGQMIANSPNFTLLDATLPDVARLVTAMVQARDAVERAGPGRTRKSRRAKSGGPTCWPILALESASGAPT